MECQLIRAKNAMVNNMIFSTNNMKKATFSEKKAHN